VRPTHPRTLAGIVVAGALTGGVAVVMLGVAGGWWEPGTAVAQSTQESAKARARAVRSASQASPAKPAGTPASAPASPAPASVASGTAKSAGVTPAAGKAGTVKGKAPAPSPIVQTTAHLDDQVAYQYNALGRRDPFMSLMGGEYVGSDVGGDAPPDVGGLKVVGIVWGDADQFALVEDARGDSHVMRRGDKVMNGFVEALKRDAMIVNLTVDGQSQSVRVPLTRKGDNANANR
jgi:hypothetical protein